MSRAALEIENIALRSQLALYQQQALSNKIPKSQPTPAFRRNLGYHLKTLASLEIGSDDRQTGNNPRLVS
jgi:hypothetical protein